MDDLEPNVPYAIIIEGDDIDLPVFENKTIVTPNELTVIDENGQYDFVGTYADLGKNNAIVMEGDYIAGVKAFKKASGGNRIAAYRAYLKHLTDFGAKLVFNFAGRIISGEDGVGEDGGFTDGINQATADSSNSNIYNLQGMRTKKATKGVYIQNGKKIIVK